ncbi:MAG: AmmeMemoRadiSam system radical SAM enzyme [Candidatus Omnitrophica bacterium]|nr:AmmeMemoRadiSam system radical SAM enzyme [Candidatus Omnitrophota bacterium]
MKEALLYKKTEDEQVSCFLCSHRCLVPEGGFGICGVRLNRGGTLYTLVYGKPVAMHVDPIEKKPLYHFLPGSLSFSVATAGCNFRCGFCQNWQISQAKPGDGPEGPATVLPQELVRAASENKCASISYTYTEPTIFFEYALETAARARKEGLRNVFVTNGYMTPEAITELVPFLDAANVDLKFFRDDAYRKVCGGSLQPVCDSIALMKKAGVWVEVTTLVIPGENDSQDELSGIAGFIAGVSRDIPWHVSRFHPDYRFTAQPPTPSGTLKEAERIGKEQGLRFVYCGNVAGWDENTYCRGCGKPVVTRAGFSVREYNLEDGRCVFCGEKTPGIFNGGRKQH